MKQTLIFSIFILFVFNVHGQSKTITGTVINEELELIPYVSIFSLDTVEIAKTNIDGEFNISILEETNQLMFGFVGMEWLTIKFVDNCDNLEVIMMSEWIYDFISLRKADRLRKKRFDKLPEVRKKAFEQGIFKSDSLNYSQEFDSYRDD
tara:strand:- start:11510 stop:11959 length:450 start_codon:yes stop_codon:yes gene_type:complete